MNLLGLALLAAPCCMAKPVQLIIDTDLGFDVDDVGALAVANHLQDIGECEILAVVHNTGFYEGIGGVDTVQNFYGRDNFDVQYGAYTGQWGSSSDAQSAQNAYTTTIESDYPANIQNYDQVQSATDAYIAALSAAEDGSVVIASIGELTNLRDIVEANLELVSQKVTKIVYMDGGYNFGCGDSDGSGWSPWLGSTEDCDGAAQIVVDAVPHNITQYFSPVGGDVYTGGRFTSGCGSGPVKEAYQIWTNYGSRPSWDPMAVYFAVRGVGWDSLYSSADAGFMTVDYYGGESWDSSQDAFNEYYISTDGDYDGTITKILDDLLCASPCLNSTAKYGGCAGYTMNTMSNCYNGHGGDEIDGDSAGVMALSDCQALCDATDGCDGVTIAAAEGSTPGFVNCWRKSNVEISECDFDYSFDTYTKN